MNTRERGRIEFDVDEGDGVAFEGEGPASIVVAPRIAGDQTTGRTLLVAVLFAKGAQHFRAPLGLLGGTPVRVVVEWRGHTLGVAANDIDLEPVSALAF